MHPVYDLHTHTTASDGEFSPKALVIKAKNSGVDILAITDHDSTEGIAEAESAACKQTIRLLPGIELSVSWMD